MEPGVALAAVAARLVAADRILLTSHRRPDGDGTGSMIGLAVLLRAHGKTVTLFSPDLTPRRFHWLALIPAWTQRLPNDARFDCTVIVDCADEALLGGSLPAAEVTGTIITLDHHASAKPFGELVLWDPSAAAVGVLIARLADHLGWPIDRDAATALYVSIISDTGGFRHANTNSEALSVAARLVACGAIPVMVAQRMEERSSAAKLRLLAAVLGTLELHGAGRIAALTVTPAMIDDALATWDDIEGMVNWARNVDGAHVGVMFTNAKGGGVRVSMRSRSERIDCGAVCMSLGGGGHPGAGGVHLPGDVDAAKITVIAALEQSLSRAPSRGRGI